MIQQRHRARSALYLTGDLVATLVAFFAAWYLRFESPVVPLTKGLPEFQPYLVLLPAVLLLWPLVFYFHGLYQMRRGRSRVDELLTLVVAVLLGAILLSSFSAWYRPPLEPGSTDYFTYSRWFLGLFVGLDLLLVAVTRLAIRQALQRRQLQGHNLQRILVVGAGRLGKEIAGKLQAHRELGFDVVGFLDDDPGKSASSFHGIPVLGSIHDVERVVSSELIDQVYIALPLEAHKKMLRALQNVARECVEVKLVPDILQYATLKATLEDLDGTPVINLSQVPLQGWTSLIKRVIDVGVAAGGIAALTFVLPVFPILAAAIWLQDRRPIFYQQERMGLDGKSFMIWKFRSMRIDAENSTGPVWAIRNDARRTRVGSFLRRWSLDELPQLWNVLRGDMSLVGPRPERPTFVREFKHKIPQYMVRHRVKAGITGWAQVHGWRGNTSIRKRIQYDLYYIENWSLKLDLKILWMTVRHS
ncbi:MAG TPA: undecaprenyl-phosphate glucose phosphotransferase, partial [Thermoanaerobaculia bacterium]|nr:undecaprenyl-phosphate glucose phosphotransferase [Thermoanaerobaculia bacterium]